MRINVIEKFDLYERLESLTSKLAEHEESQNICKKMVHGLKSKFTNTKFKGYLNELEQYKWIEDIEQFFEAYSEFVTENKYGLRFEFLMNRLQGTGSGTYAPIIEKISQILPLDESDIKDKICEFNEFKFEPSIRNVIEVYENEAFNKEVKGTSTILGNTLSPITKVNEGEGGFIFTTGRDNHFIISNGLDKIEKYNGKLTSAFKAGQLALENFKYVGNDTFKFATGKGTIKVIAGEESNRIFVNESEISDKKTLNRVLKTTGVINYADTKTRAMVEYMFENAHTFAEIDFAKKIETTNENLTIFKLSNNTIVLDKEVFATRTKTFESLDIDQVEELSESIKSNYGLDFNNVVEGLSINKECMLFEKAVSEINVSDLMDIEKSAETIAKIEKASNLLESIDDVHKDSVSAITETFKTIQDKANSDKVTFLLETRDALIEKMEPESEELTESLELINGQLTELL